MVSPLRHSCAGDSLQDLRPVDSQRASKKKNPYINPCSCACVRVRRLCTCVCVKFSIYIECRWDGPLVSRFFWLVHKIWSLAAAAAAVAQSHGSNKDRATKSCCSPRLSRRSSQRSTRQQKTIFCFYFYEKILCVELKNTQKKTKEKQFATDLNEVVSKNTNFFEFSSFRNEYVRNENTEKEPTFLSRTGDMYVRVYSAVSNLARLALWKRIRACG